MTHNIAKQLLHSKISQQLWEEAQSFDEGTRASITNMLATVHVNKYLFSLNHCVLLGCFSVTELHQLALKYKSFSNRRSFPPLAGYGLQDRASKLDIFKTST
ncbi:hypothetical protein CR513_52599, partial [Mucuna pruriens]